MVKSQHFLNINIPFIKLEVHSVVLEGNIISSSSDQAEVGGARDASYWCRG